MGRCPLPVDRSRPYETTRFVYDHERGSTSCSTSTPAWKWVDLPVATDANLPVAAYADATGVEYDPAEPADCAELRPADRSDAIASSDVRESNDSRADETFDDVLREE